MAVKAGYKQTEIGVIPEDWTSNNLGVGISLLSGHHILAEHCNTKGDGIPYLTGPADFPNGTIKHSKFTTRPSTRCQSQDILVTVKGSGSGSIVVSDAVYCISRQLMAIRVRDWDSRYVFYSLVGNSSQFEAASTGLIPGLSRSDILGAAITLPPLPEQQAIAQALSDVDQLIASLDQLIEKRRALKTATMQQLLTGKTRLAGFSGEWETKRFIDFAIIDPETLGANTDPNYQFNYISLEDVEKGTLKGFSELDFRSAPSRARRKLSTMDILIATVRPNLQSHLLFSTTTPNWICSTGFAVIRCIQNISCPAFIYQHLFGNTLCAQIATLISGSNYPAISSNDVRALQIPLPSIEEQQAIAEVLSDMDAEIAELEQRRDKTIAIKQGMMQDLLTGRTRLI